MFLLKQFIGTLVMPLTFACFMVVLACVFWVLRRRRIAGALLVAAAVAAYLSSTTMVANLLLRPLASAYSSPLENPPPVKYVVVLGAWYGPRADLPITASLNQDGLARIVEAVRLVRKLPGALLVVSGGAPASRNMQPSAHGYAKMAQALGVDAASIIVLDKALDTASEARDIAAVLHSEPFLLVTSADHLRRAMRLMERVGARAIPAPATRRPGPFEWRQLIPSSSGLKGTEACIHEYMGLAAISLGLD